MPMPLTNASTSSSSRRSVPERLRGLLVPAGLGLVLAAIHATDKLALGLPGHFGLLWMAGMVLARAGSSERHAALASALAYVAGTWGFAGLAWHALGQAPGYLLAAWLLDTCWRWWPQAFGRAWSAALVGGLAFLCKPLLMAGAVSLFDLAAGSLRQGLSFALLTHFAFGACGALIGLYAWRAAHAARPPAAP